MVSSGILIYVSSEEVLNNEKIGYGIAVNRERHKSYDQIWVPIKPIS